LAENNNSVMMHCSVRCTSNERTTEVAFLNHYKVQCIYSQNLM